MWARELFTFSHKQIVFFTKSAAELPLPLIRQDQDNNFYQDEHIPRESTCITQYIQKYSSLID